MEEMVEVARYATENVKEIESVFTLDDLVLILLLGGNQLLTEGLTPLSEDRPLLLSLNEAHGDHDGNFFFHVLGYPLVLEMYGGFLILLTKMEEVS